MNEVSDTLSLGVSWSRLRRLEFIETCLFWEGRLNRADLCNRFGISVPQATTDIKEYLSLAPGNCTYDPSAKTYVASTDYAPKIIQPSADRYLQQLSLIKSGYARERDIYVASVPPCDIVPAPARPVRNDLLRALLRAIREHKSLEIVYQSLSHDQPQSRRISPHALGSDGLRWHVRAYCHKDASFKDFVLGRILNLGALQKSDIDPNQDWEWNTFQEITIMPNPKLSVDQQQHIASDFGMPLGISSIKIRTALLFYFEKILNRGSQQDKPAARPIVSPNLAEVMKFVDEKKKTEGAAVKSAPHQEIKVPLETLYTQVLITLESVFKELEKKVPAPEKLELPNGSIKFRYRNKSIQQAIILKLARVISGLHAILTLNVQGLYQEQGLMHRVVDELNEDILFLCGALLFDDRTELHNRYLEWFYAEEFSDELAPMATHVSRPMVPRQKIRSYVVHKYLNDEDEANRTNEVGKVLHKVYSGFVHAAMPHIMETYGGDPPYFHISGMLGTPRTHEFKLDAWNYFYRGIQAFCFVALAFEDQQIYNNVAQFMMHFEDAVGKNCA